MSNQTTGTRSGSIVSRLDDSIKFEQGDPFHTILPAGKPLSEYLEECTHDPNWKFTKDIEGEGTWWKEFHSLTDGTCRLFQLTGSVGKHRPKKFQMDETKVPTATKSTFTSIQGVGVPRGRIIRTKETLGTMLITRSTACPWDKDPRYTYARHEDLDTFGVHIFRQRTGTAMGKDTEKDTEDVLYDYIVNEKDYHPMGGPSLWELNRRWGIQSAAASRPPN
ncbi:hypothetical protein M231_03980 [Tremella mesenterica]|uniref:Uncharacterized protein n=1 Tax=Tremella mesenterica TaxID=5217 RepID=A0A4Q1BLX6_TREME|nr:hypothetical protein M231_03980 [Tremella mesenterica]